MYESPINIIEKAVTELHKQQEEGVFRAIMEYGISADKDELLKALSYDRDQYKKGYADGVREFAERAKAKAYEPDSPFGGADDCEVVDVIELEEIAKEMGVEL